MEAKDWITRIIQKETQDSVQQIPSALHARLFSIPKGMSNIISWKQIIAVAAGLALLISLNVMVFSENSTSNQSETEEFSTSYFSHLSSI